MVARLVGDEAEQIDRIGMVGRGREDLPVKLLGDLQPTRLVVLDRNRQGFGNRCHDAYYDVTARGGNVFPKRGHVPRQNGS